MDLLGKRIRSPIDEFLSYYVLCAGWFFLRKIADVLGASPASPVAVEAVFRGYWTLRDEQCRMKSPIPAIRVAA